MKRIPIDTIIPAADPVRKSWDEEEFERLAKSIDQHGIIQPVKVRKIDDAKYEIVYGHRRVEATRLVNEWRAEELPAFGESPRPKIAYVPAIVQEMEDDQAHTEALTENMVREDMSAYEIAVALKKEIDETGDNQSEVARRYGLHRTRVSQYLSLLDYEKVYARNNSLGLDHVRQAEAGTGGDKELAAKVLEKVADEELSTRTTRKIADKLQVSNESTRTRLLNKPWEDWTDDDREVVSNASTVTFKETTFDDLLKAFRKLDLDFIRDNTSLLKRYVDDPEEIIAAAEAVAEHKQKLISRVIELHEEKDDKITNKHSAKRKYDERQKQYEGSDVRRTGRAAE